MTTLLARISQGPCPVVAAEDARSSDPVVAMGGGLIASDWFGAAPVDRPKEQHGS